MVYTVMDYYNAHQTDNIDVGDNHQVLAYGYRKSGQMVRLYIYDPNEGEAS